MTDDVIKELRAEARTDVLIADARKEAFLALEQLVTSLRHRGFTVAVNRTLRGCVELQFDPVNVRLNTTKDALAAE